MPEEGIPLARRQVRHLPGDEVRVEIGFFRHEMKPLATVIQDLLSILIYFVIVSYVVA